MEKRASSLEEKVEEIHDYQIDPHKLEKSLLILKIALGGTISK